MRHGLAIAIFAAAIVAEAVFYAAAGPETIQTGVQGMARILGLPYNTFLVLLGTGLLGLASGVVGAFAVLRRRSLIGDAVSHAALPGLCAAFFVLGTRQFEGMLLGATLSGLLGVFVIAWLQRHTRIKSDAAIGIVLSVFYGLGIVMSRIIQDDPSGQQAGLDSFLLGKTAGMVSQDLFLIAVVAANVVLIVALLHKEFKLIGFDPSFAAVQGWPVLLIDGVLMALLVATVIIGLPAVGVVLMAALVILPGISARFWTDRLSTLLVLAGLFGLLTGVTGTWVSTRAADLPAGAVIVLAGAGLFFLSMLVAPRRGVAARLAERAAASWQAGRDHLLRALYEVSERTLPERPAVRLSALRGARKWSAAMTAWLLFVAKRRGEVETAGGDAVRLTALGVETAAEIVRRHRLWELYLVEQAAIAADHVDRDADEIEHVLTPEIADRIETVLRESGKLPDEVVPTSVHPVEAAEPPKDR
ncbi:MAG: iron ABC transporter [Myxococcales bacterium]|nr:MAG: iron ABC transporter [Myxococcales bacterium]